MVRLQVEQAKSIAKYWEPQWEVTLGDTVWGRIVWTHRGHTWATSVADCYSELGRKVDGTIVGCGQVSS